MLGGIGSALGKIANGVPMSQIGGILGGIAGKVGQQAAGSFGKGGLGAIAGAAMQKGKLAGRDTHKAAYLAALAHAMERAHKSQHFNMETHINDLWTKLSHLRSGAAHLDKMHDAIDGHHQHSAELQSILQAVGGPLSQILAKFK